LGLNKLDPKDKFETSVTKWKRILEVVMSMGFIQHLRNGLACKVKWRSISNDFKKIFDYTSKILGIESSKDGISSSTLPLWPQHV
jgi:hypothetical protein